MGLLSFQRCSVAWSINKFCLEMVTKFPETLENLENDFYVLQMGRTLSLNPDLLIKQWIFLRLFNILVLVFWYQ